MSQVLGALGATAAHSASSPQPVALGESDGQSAKGLVVLAHRPAPAGHDPLAPIRHPLDRLIGQVPAPVQEAVREGVILRVQPVPQRLGGLDQGFVV